MSFLELAQKLDPEIVVQAKSTLKVPKILLPGLIKGSDCGYVKR